MCTLCNRIFGIVVNDDNIITRETKHDTRKRHTTINNESWRIIEQ
jgi:hypothetical protein